MSFGEDLRCPQAHAAVIRLLDSELHLMEVMRKWMGHRAKSEREFSTQLQHMSTMAEKLERPAPAAGQEYISQLNKVRSADRRRIHPVAELSSRMWSRSLKSLLSQFWYSNMNLLRSRAAQFI